MGDKETAWDGGQNWVEMEAARQAPRRSMSRQQGRQLVATEEDREEVA